MMEIEKYKIDVQGASNCFKLLIKTYLPMSQGNSLEILGQTSQNKTLDQLKREINSFMFNLKQLKQLLNQIIQSLKSKQNKNNQQQQKRGYYNSYSPQFKKVVIETVEAYTLTMNQAGDLFHIPAKNVFRWCNKGYTKRKGGGRKSLDQRMEISIYAWLGECQKQNKIVTSNQVRMKAMQLSTVPNFKASKGWLDKFRARFNIPKFPNSSHQKSSEINKEIPPKNKQTNIQLNLYSQQQRQQQSIFQQMSQNDQQQKQNPTENLYSQHDNHFKKSVTFQKDLELMNVVSTLSNDLLQTKSQFKPTLFKSLKSILPNPKLKQSCLQQTKNIQPVEKKRGRKSKKNLQAPKLIKISKQDKKQQLKKKIDTTSSNNLSNKKNQQRNRSNQKMSIFNDEPLFYTEQRLGNIKEELDSANFNITMLKKQEPNEFQRRNFYYNDMMDSDF